MEEEEEMWFNDEDDYDDNEAIVHATTDILSKKLDTDLDTIGKMMEKKPEANGPKMNNNSTPKATVLNNNPSTGQTPSPTTTENKSALFKRVCVKNSNLSMLSLNS